MTTTPSSTATTTPIRRGVNTQPSTLFDFTDMDSSTRTYLPKLQSLIDQAIAQWFSGLTTFQKYVLYERNLSLKISASCWQSPALTLKE